MTPKEAQAKIKINKLLEVAGWRFFDEAAGRANVALEPNVKLTQAIDPLHVPRPLAAFAVVLRDKERIAIPA
jgi:hypothetical protein